MNRRSPCRPSLKITQTGDQTETKRFRIEVWNPFRHDYQPVNSVADGITRVGQLANLIDYMWREHHPKRDALMDVPVAEPGAGQHWAELRINGTAFRNYDIRSDDRPLWAKATDMKQAAATICAEVGYALQSSGVP